jgi:hypothetical protein
MFQLQPLQVNLQLLSCGSLISGKHNIHFLNTLSRILTELIGSKKVSFGSLRLSLNNLPKGVEKNTWEKIGNAEINVGLTAQDFGSGFF